MNGRLLKGLCCLACLHPGVLGAVSEHPALGVEVTVQNDSLGPGEQGVVVPGFVVGESAAVWLTSPCDGDIVAVQVFWRSQSGSAPDSMEDSITIFQAGTFPSPGATLAVINSPVMVDSLTLNEFRYSGPTPLSVPVTSGQEFVVSFKFLNAPGSSGPSIVRDDDGCQWGKNAIDAIGIGWADSCAFGLTGDFAIRAVIEQPELEGACCLPDETCIAPVTESECDSQGGMFGGEDTRCACWSPVPTVGEWGLTVMVILLMAAATVVFSRRREPVTA